MKEEPPPNVEMFSTLTKHSTIVEGKLPEDSWLHLPKQMPPPDVEF